MKARIFGIPIWWLVALLTAFAPAPPASALPDAEVKALMSVSPAFKAAEEEIVALWQRLPQTAKQKLKTSQLEWIKTVRDKEAKKFMDQGYSFTQAYTRVTQDKARELRQYFPGQIKRAEFMALEPNDSRTNASKMTACGESLLQYFHQDSDSDWTRFHARPKTNYTIFIYPLDANLKIAGQVFGSGDQPLPFSLEKNGEVWTIRANFEDTGFYYLKTAPAGKLAGPVRYEIAIRAEACP